jgi:hypothetical protein
MTLALRRSKLKLGRQHENGCQPDRFDHVTVIRYLLTASFSAPCGGGYWIGRCNE